MANDNVLKWDETLDSDDRGMYGGGEETAIEYIELGEDDVSIASDINGEGGVYDKYGNDATAREGEIDVNSFFGTSDGGSTANILGLPMPFSKQCDPMGRVFKETIMTDLPLLFIVPGRTILNNKLVKDNGKKIGKGKILTLLEDAENILRLGVLGPRHGKDLRFLGFKQDYKRFYKYVDTMLNVIHANMGLPGLYSFADSFEEKSKTNAGLTSYGLCYYLEKSTSINEGNSNDYTTTSVTQQANDLAAQNREAKMMLGINTEGKAKGIVGKALQFVAESAQELKEGVESLSGILSRAGNIFGRIVNGSQLLYPEIWTNSTNDKSYNLSFKFYSPYGDPEAIFHYVYVPFIPLVALSYPVQDNVMGYGQPFVMKITSPGLNYIIWLGINFFNFWNIIYLIIIKIYKESEAI